MIDEPASDTALADGFAAHAGRWAVQAGATTDAADAAARAARAVSLATSAGHVCIPLETLAGSSTSTAALRAQLLACGIVGTAEAPGAHPLVIDAEDRLYLHRYFDYERSLAQRLVQAPAPRPLQPDARVLLQRLYAANETRLQGRADWQKVATALALERRITIISGGPGTGKTTTVVNLLACLLAENPACRIALAAPTGKAAARMLEAVRLRAAGLPPAIRAALPERATTIHRLLGAGAEGFRHDARNPLAIDALVVDEASMLDLALAARLLEAVPDAARVVLLGDKDQLAAVEAGAVFAELSADPALSPACRARLAAACELPADAIEAPAAAGGASLPDSTVWLRENYRFAAATGIARLAADIRDGRDAEALDWLARGGDASVAWLDDAEPRPGAATLALLVAGYDAYLDALRRDLGDAVAITHAFGHFRTLCALREGARGVAGVNRAVEQAVRQALGATDTRSPWYPGRPVLVLRNDALLGLYNGDIGIALPDASGDLMVHFPDAQGGLRAVAPLRLPPHQTAFALTVHKAQGSEFERVALLLPGAEHRLLSRELLYTALTRARSHATLIGAAGALAQSIRTATERHSGLQARLRELRSG